jgi:hypothetical protein
MESDDPFYIEQLRKAGTPVTSRKRYFLLKSILSQQKKVISVVDITLKIISSMPLKAGPTSLKMQLSLSELPRLLCCAMTVITKTWPCCGILKKCN